MESTNKTHNRNNLLRRIGLTGATTLMVLNLGACSSMPNSLNPMNYFGTNNEQQQETTQKDNTRYDSTSCPEFTTCKGTFSQMMNPSMYAPTDSLDKKIETQEEYQANLWRNAQEAAKSSNGTPLTTNEYITEMQSKRKGDYYMAVGVAAGNATALAATLYGIGKVLEKGKDGTTTIIQKAQRVTGNGLPLGNVGDQSK